MIHWLVYTYWPEVRGNVYAVVPCAVLAALWVRSKHQALLESHRAHAVKLTRILEHLDPDAQTDGLLDLIADRTDERTPGGVGAVLAALHNPNPKEPPA